MECEVCLDKCSKYMKCNNTFCTSTICNDCFVIYLDHIYKNSEMPKCIGRSCEFYYLYSNINVDVLQLYIDILHRSLNKTNILTLSKDSIIEAIRLEKKKFILSNYPPSICLVAEICMKKKINDIIDKKSKKIKSKLCMNSFCDGCLDSEYKCNKCGSSFCDKCEKLLTTSHICNLDDNKSIIEIKNFPTCPKCGINLDKNEACNDVMCGVCGTKFIYRTSNIGGSGGHTTMVTVKDKVSLSVQYRDILKQDDINILLLIENKKLNNSNWNTVLNSLKDENKHKVGKTFENYAKHKLIYKIYLGYLSEIENRIINKTLTTEYLKTVLDVINLF